MIKDVTAPSLPDYVKTNVIVTEMKGIYELWFKMGGKTFFLDWGSKNRVMEKADRIERFISDPLRPRPKSATEVIQMVKGL